jgi:hypothetical protein
MNVHLKLGVGKSQLEAMGGCLLRATTNLLATASAGWNGGIATDTSGASLLS